jgi:hypothetical protein
MKRLKGGPEIKLPELRVPQFLADLYIDFKDRHLLPVVAILIVGIVAIPLLLGGSSDSSEAGSGAEAGASASIAPESKQSALVVAKAAPGLRDYKRRLKHLQPTDPFKPRYTTSEQSETGTSESSSETTEAAATTESSSTTTVETGGDESGGGTAPSGGQSSTEPEVTFFSYAIDVRVTPVSAGDGKPSEAKPTVRHDLPPLVMLPSRDTPALTYIGPSRDGKKAMMMVSSDVTALFGDSNCIVGSQTCQLLALEPGLPETIVYGPQARTYRIELLKLEIVTSDHLNRAALGKPKPGKAG